MAKCWVMPLIIRAMKLFAETLPVALFVLAYFFYPDLPAAWVAAIGEGLRLELAAGAAADRIYFATLVLMAAMPLQCAAMRAMRQLTATHLAALAIVWVAGSLTVLLKDPLFIKWKPTVFYWALAGAFLLSGLTGAKTLVERMLAKALPLEDRRVWRRLNAVWVGFFAFCGALNLYVAYGFSEEAWVQFKLFGLALGLPVLFLLAQMAYLAPHLEHTEKN